MKRFYIEAENFWKLLIISFAILSLLPLKYFLVWLMCLGIILFLFRKNRSQYKDFIANDNMVCLSPVDGRVLKIEKMESAGEYKSVIVFKMGPLNPYGLFCPFDSLVDSLDIKQESSHKNRLLQFIYKGKLDCRVKFKDKEGFLSMVRIQKVPIFGEPKLWIRTGDKALAGACFGVNPYGGNVKIYFPENVNIAVRPGDRVIAGETLIAGVRN